MKSQERISMSFVLLSALAVAGSAAADEEKEIPASPYEAGTAVTKRYAPFAEDEGLLKQSESPALLAAKDGKSFQLSGVMVAVNDGQFSIKWECNDTQRAALKAKGAPDRPEDDGFPPPYINNKACVTGYLLAPWLSEDEVRGITQLLERRVGGQVRFTLMRTQTARLYISSAR